MKKRKVVFKLFAGVLLIIGLGALTIYEVDSVIRKEHFRQNELFVSSKDAINHELDLVKIAVFTKTPEDYKDNLTLIKNELDEIRQLSFIAPEQTDYINKVDNYIILLDSKTPSLVEMQRLGDKINAIKDKLNELYKDEGGITKEKIQSAKDDINGLKINTEEYQEEKPKKIVDAVNGVLNTLIEGVNEISGCIDECYENKMSTIGDELSNKLKEAVEKLPALNQEFEEIFQFDTLKGIQ